METKILTTIESIEAKPGQRLLVVSDIHGHLNRLVQLLEKMNYGGDDILILAGDLIEKGPESLRVVQYVMDLCRRRPVYVSMGNVEYSRLQLLWRVLQTPCPTKMAEAGCESAGGFCLEDTNAAAGKADGGSAYGSLAAEAARELAGYIRWSSEYWGSCLFQEMLADLGIPVSQVTAENVTEYMVRAKERFGAELAFLGSRPTILTAGEYLFVHGGVPTDELSALEGQSAAQYLKNDRFWSQAYRFQSYTVVAGHWPVCLYRPEEENVSPLFDSERRIICIDGGCGVKASGQLNGLMIPGCRAEMKEIAWTGCDDFPVVTALEAQAPRAADVHIQYLDNEVELLEEFGGMGRVRLLSTGKEFAAPLNWLWGRHADGRAHCEDYSDGRLAVTPGEKLSVILCCEGKDKKIRRYVKNARGEIGWYEGAVRGIRNM